VTRTGRLSIVLGIDGSGKSTAMAHLRSHGYAISHWKHLKDAGYDALNFTNPSEELSVLRGTARLDYIRPYIVGEWELVAAELTAGVDVISDGLYVKFYVKERIYDRLDLAALAKLDPLPADTLFVVLDTPPEVAMARKTSVTPYECFTGPEDFVAFQSLQRQAIFDYVAARPNVVVNGLRDKHAVANDVMAVLQEHGITPQFPARLMNPFGNNSIRNTGDELHKGQSETPELS
jgi:thymidylate kinase